MRFSKSSNPVLSQKRFKKIDVRDGELVNTMTFDGTINKTFILFSLLIVSSWLSWSIVVAETVSFGVLIGTGFIGGLIFAIVTIFKPHLSPYTAPFYALFEGLAVGALSAFYSSLFDGIVIKAIGITLSILFIMLMLYKTGVIRATPKFKKGVIVATGGVLFFYVLNFIFSSFGGGISLSEFGIIGIGIQLVIIVIASLNLVLDFDYIEESVKSGMPKYIEWYAGFGIMVTLVWLYFEILRLLSLVGRN